MEVEKLDDIIIENNSDENIEINLRDSENAAAIFGLFENLTLDFNDGISIDGTITDYNVGISSSKIINGQKPVIVMSGGETTDLNINTNTENDLFTISCRDGSNDTSATLYIENEGQQINDLNVNGHTTIKDEASNKEGEGKSEVKSVSPKITLSSSSFAYNGKVQKPTVTVKSGSTALKAGTDYDVSYAGNCKDVGTYKVTVKLKGKYKGTGTASYKIVKAANTLTVKGKTAKVKYSKLKKKKQTVKAAKAFTVSGAQGRVTYKLASVKKAKFKKYFKVSKSGKITVKKGLKKGTYKLKVNVTAAGNANYKPLTKSVTVKVKVK